MNTLCWVRRLKTFPATPTRYWWTKNIKQNILSRFALHLCLIRRFINHKHWYGDIRWFIIYIQNFLWSLVSFIKEILKYFDLYDLPQTFSTPAVHTFKCVRFQLHFYGWTVFSIYMDNSNQGNFLICKTFFVRYSAKKMLWKCFGLWWRSKNFTTIEPSGTLPSLGIMWGQLRLLLKPPEPS